MYTGDECDQRRFIFDSLVMILRTTRSLCPHPSSYSCVSTYTCPSNRPIAVNSQIVSDNLHDLMHGVLVSSTPREAIISATSVDANRRTTCRKSRPNTSGVEERCSGRLRFRQRSFRLARHRRARKLSVQSRVNELIRPKDNRLSVSCCPSARHELSFGRTSTFDKLKKDDSSSF